MIEIKDLYDLDHTLAKDYLSQYKYPWEALKGIKDLILALGPTLPKDEYTEVSEHVWVAKNSTCIPKCLFRSTMHYRPEYRSASLCLYPFQCFGRCGLCSGKQCRAEKCHPVRSCADAALQLCR
jgi:hypothetical protein